MWLRVSIACHKTPWSKYLGGGNPYSYTLRNKDRDWQELAWALTSNLSMNFQSSDRMILRGLTQFTSVKSYSITDGKVRSGTQAEPGSGNWSRGCGERLCRDLLLRPCLACFLKTTYPGVTLTAVSRAHPQETSVKKMRDIFACWQILWIHCLNWESSFPNDASSCQDDIKLINTIHWTISF